MCPGLRFQQTRVRVWAEFMAEDPESGRREFFPARGSEIEVTEVVAAGKGLRVKDPKMASIRNIGSGAVVVGRYPGKTQVKVRSCIWMFSLHL